MVVEFLNTKVEFDEVVDEFDSHGPYCKEVEVQGSDDEGFEYSAIGISDGDEITEIDIDSIECIGYMDNNPDDGSWVGR